MDVGISLAWNTVDVAVTALVSGVPKGVTAQDLDISASDAAAIDVVAVAPSFAVSGGLVGG